MVAQLFRIRYLLLIELALLILFAVYGFVPVLVALSLVLSAVIIYLAYNFPITAVHILLFSILIDSFIPKKYYSSETSFLVVEFFLVLLVTIGIIKFLSSADKLSHLPKIILIWLPFLIWSLLIGILVAVDKFTVISFWKNYFAGFFALILTYYAVNNIKYLKSVIVGIITWGLILSLLEFKVLIELGGFTTGIIGLFLKKNLLTLGWGRSNYLAAFFVIIIPLTIGYLFYTNNKRTKSLAIISLVLMSFAMILTLSRGGVLALFIALIILFSKLFNPKTIIPLFIILAVITTVLILNPLTSVLFEGISSLETSDSVYSRLNYYEDIWNSFLDNPITGVGFGNLRYYATFILGPNESPSAHNIVLGALGENGIIGTILYFSMLGLLTKTIYSSYKTETNDSLKILKWSFFASLVGALSHTLVEPTLDGLQFSIIFWTLAGVFLKLDLLKN